MSRSTTEIRQEVMKLGRSLNVLNKSALDLNLQILAAIAPDKQEQLQQKLRQTEQELQEVDQQLTRLEAEYQHAFELEKKYGAEKGLPADTSGADAALQPYLQWVLEQCSGLSLAGIDRKTVGREQEAPINLGAVYTELFTTGGEERELLKAAGRKSAEELLEERGGDRRLSALEQLHAHDRLVLLGDPGSGKSTFVNFIAMCLAEERLPRATEDNEQPAGLARLTAFVAKEEDDDEKKKTAQPPDWSFQQLIPVRIILRDFAARGLPPEGETATQEHVWAFLSKECQNAGLPPEIAPRLRAMVEQGGGLLLFDGLDEVPDAQQRREQIRNVVKDCREHFCQCRMLVTSRTYAYQNQGWNLEDFYVTKLADFSDVQIAYFVEHWYRHIGTIRNQDLSENRDKLMQAITHSDRLKDFARLPLLLTLMTSLHAWRGGSLPEKREELYNDAVDLLLDWWQSRKGLKIESLTELLAISKERLLRTLSVLAFDVHKQQENLAGTADIPEKELVSRLLAVSANLELRPLDLAEYFNEQRTGLLTPRGVGVFSFPHRTFQEYLAACALTEGDDFPENVADEVHADPERWREVALLAGAKAARGAKANIWLLTEALCDEDLPWNVLNAEHTEETAHNAWGALLAGQMLLESAELSAVSFRHQPKLERVRRWLAAILTEQVALEPDKPFPAVERALAGRLLAKLGDLRPGVGLLSPPGRGQGWVAGLPDIEWRDIPAGSFLMGSDKQVDKFADDDEMPQHRVTLPTFQMSRYPVTNAQYQAFVDDGGYTDKWQNCWTDEGWKEKEENDWTGPLKLRDPFGFPNHPVVGVSWYEAVAFCNWLTIKTSPPTPLRQERGDAPPLRGGDGGGVIRLPSEAEWEYAARGPENDIYPWGNEPQPNPELANYDETNLGETSAVGCFPRGKSVFSGCEELAGNVWEWCLDVWHDNHKDTPADGSAWQEGEDINLRLLKGGSWVNPSGGLRCAYRGGDWRLDGNVVRGFRPVRAVGGQYSDF